MRALKSLLPFELSFKNPVVTASVLILGLALMIGTPLLAQDHGDDHGTPTEHDKTTMQEGHGASSHDDHGAAEDHGGDHGAAAGGHGDGHGDEAHGDDHGGGGVKHFPTLAIVLASAIEGHEVHTGDWGHVKNPVARALVRYEAPIYSGILILILTIFFARASKNMTLIPGKLQNLAELIVEGLDNFVKGVVGPEGGRYVPFIGTLGLYIYVSNIFGLIPMMYSPTAVLSTTFALALCVFLYVQFHALRMHGLKGFLFHLAGEPKDAVGWGMAPLMFPLHLIGEIAKPISLSLRLFGNIMGEELLLAVFAGLGISILAFAGLPIGIPLHVPFIFLALLTTLIQALVFTLLSTIYIALVMPHDEHH